MPVPVDQVLTVAQMRAAEEALMASGTDVHRLMQIAGRGAADWVWRVAAHRPVTVLCGPGNNGGDGYVIAEALRERGATVAVIAAVPPATDAARRASALFGGMVLGPNDNPNGEVLVDCLFGSGLTRPLNPDHLALLNRLAEGHAHRIAVDLPSGVESDSGRALNDILPRYHLTIALGAWKYAHFLMPSASAMGHLRLVGIGVTPQEGAAAVIRKPHLTAPAADAHKYRRGLLGVIAGAMPGAALLSCRAAQGAGAGYVRLLSAAGLPVPADLVCDMVPLAQSLADARLRAVLIGPGLGRNQAGREKLDAALASGLPLVIDADALMLLGRGQLAAGRVAPMILTPHEGELAALEQAFELPSDGSKPARALALAQATGAVVVAKGPDSVVAAPDGRLALAPRGSSWLSTAGTGDVLAGAIASRLAVGQHAFISACEGLWMQAEAARLSGPAFTAGQLAEGLQSAYAACL